MKSLTAVSYLSDDSRLIGAFCVTFGKDDLYHLFNPGGIAQKSEKGTHSYAFDLCTLLLFVNYATDAELSDPKTRANLYSRFSKVIG